MPFQHNSLLKCASQLRIEKENTKTLYFLGSRLFMVIDVDNIQKPVTSACYDKQYVCAYLQQFLC